MTYNYEIEVVQEITLPPYLVENVHTEESDIEERRCFWVVTKPPRRHFFAVASLREKALYVSAQELISNKIRSFKDYLVGYMKLEEGTPEFEKELEGYGKLCTEVSYAVVDYMRLHPAAMAGLNLFADTTSWNTSNG